MYRDFYDKAIEEVAKEADKAVTAVTLEELVKHLVDLFESDPLTGFSAPAAELYHQSGRITAVPVGGTGIVMADDSVAISILGGR